MALFELLAQTTTMADVSCLATGLCNVVKPEPTTASGLMYVAVGLVAGGFLGLRRIRQTGRSVPPEE